MATDKDKDKKKRDPSAHRDDHEARADHAQTGSGHTDESAEPVVRDKRRIDPETGDVRQSEEPAGETLTDEDIEKLLAAPEPESGASSEHLHDLKRVQAEYANYRKRVERDRHVAREVGIAEILSGMLPVLDDLDLAHAHGDLEGSPLELVVQKMRTVFARFGLEQIGAVGEPFDPKLHEAIAQLPNKDVSVDTIADVVQPGYRLGERLLRPAKVAVSVPEG